MIKQRPLSPHLQIYRPQLTSVLSISHRFTGVALFGGAILWALWLASLSAGPEAYSFFCEIMAFPLIQFFLFGLLLSFFYHLCNGLRHLAWDGGLGLSLKRSYQSGWTVVGTSFLLTSWTWWSFK